MRFRVGFALAIGFMAVGTLAQDRTPKPRVTDDPLPAEQVAIYRAAVKHYLKKLRTTVDLANVTEPFNLNGASSDDSCAKDIELDRPDASAPVVHKVNAATLADPRIVLVDPEKQMAKMTRSDPRDLMEAYAEGKPVAQDDLNTWFDLSDETGMLALSEVAYDKLHQQAVVNMRFYCGSGCAHGVTLILRRAGHEWKVKRACGGWMS